MAEQTPEATRLVTEVADGVMRLTLDGPHRRNALGRPLFGELADAVHRARTDDAVRAVLVTGSGGYFCSGADLSGSAGVTGGAAAGSGDLMGTAHTMLDALRRLPKPTIAAVEGGAVGIGWSLALACDLTVATESSYFLAPFTERGLLPDGGCAWFLVQAVGSRLAARLTMLPERLPARRAEALGLVTDITPDGEAQKHALDLAKRLADGPSHTLPLLKRMLSAAERSTDYREFLDFEWFAATYNLTTPDPREGLTAFRERRKPDFRRSAAG
ncbi:enoyl-CoA hydratase-related protein [Streptomyces sp. NPDC035033]|uniref:enoyl-CoA hydratase/isomerase family protein n=1 Tax=Streptomyces sp. NPDC035033 TaxID=3155368 RepID=UPI0033BFD8DA